MTYHLVSSELLMAMSRASAFEWRFDKRSLLWSLILIPCNTISDNWKANDFAGMLFGAKTDQ